MVSDGHRDQCRRRHHGSGGIAPHDCRFSILDYIDLGADLISIRGYDNFNDAVDYGRYVLPLVREGIRQREEAKKTAAA